MRRLLHRLYRQGMIGETLRIDTNERTITLEGHDRQLITLRFDDPGVTARRAVELLGHDGARKVLDELEKQERVEQERAAQGGARFFDLENLALRKLIESVYGF